MLVRIGGDNPINVQSACQVKPETDWQIFQREMINMDSTKALSEIVRLDHDITATFAMTIAAIVNILKLHTHPMSRSESRDRE